MSNNLVLSGRFTTDLFLVHRSMRFSSGKLLTALFLVLLLLSGASSALAEYHLFAFDHDDRHDVWNNEEEAYGWDPGQAQCECTRHETAWQNYVPGTQRSLFLSDWRFLDGTEFELEYGELISGLKFNCHGRYNAGEGGDFRYRIIWEGENLPYEGPDFEFSTNDICRWRVPNNYQNLTGLRNWNEGLEDMWGSPFDDLEIAVRRRGNQNRMLLNAVRLKVYTAGVSLSGDLEDYGDGEFDMEFGEDSDCIIGEVYNLGFLISSYGDNAISGNVAFEGPAGAFALVHGGGAFTLEPNQTRAVTVSYSPQHDEGDSAILTLGIREISIYLDGYADYSELTVEPASLEFPDTYVGDSVTRNIVISNQEGGVIPGNVTLGEDDTDAFSIVSGGGPFSLSYGQSRTISVRFEPQVALEDFDCSIELGDPWDLYADCTGESLESIMVVPYWLEFDDVPILTTEEMSFQMTNISNISVPGSLTMPDSCDAFSIVSGGGSYQLAPNESREVVVAFSPTDSIYYYCDLSIFGAFDGIGLDGYGISNPASPAGDDVVLTKISLAPPRPNPTSGTSVLSFDIPVGQDATIELYDSAGRHIRTLVSGFHPVGRHKTPWDGRDGSGRPVAAGVYYAKLVTQEEAHTVKVVRIGR